MFKEILPSQIEKNPFDMFNKTWSLLSVGNQDLSNTMTISWGSLGHLWFKDIINIYVRPSRYTFELIENQDFFTVSFFNDDYKQDLTYLGKNSGKNEDKIAKTNLTPIYLDGVLSFEQADYVLLCKKVHSVDITREQFLDEEVSKVYTDDNLHRQYVGIITKAYARI